MGRQPDIDYVGIAQKILRRCGGGPLATEELVRRAEKQGSLGSSSYKYFNFTRAIRKSPLFNTPRGKVSLAEKLLRTTCPKKKDTQARSQICCAGPNTEKQRARDLMLEKVLKTFPRQEEVLRVLTFPGVQGLEAPFSLENQLRGRYDNVVLVGLERDREEFDEMQNTRPEGHGFSQLLHLSAERYFERHWGVFEAMWLDYYGGVTPSVVESWTQMFQKEMLSEPGILAYTSCEAARVSEQVLSLGDAKAELVKAGKGAGYKITPCGDLGYNQGSRHPMRISIFQVI